MFEKTEVFLSADPQRAEVAFDLKHGQVFLGADDDGPDQVGPIPHSMVAFLADKMTADFFEESLEFLVVDRAQGGHRSGGGGNFDNLAFLPNDARRAPRLFDLRPPVLLENLCPRPFFGDLLDKEPQGRGEGFLCVLKRVAVSDEIKGGRIAEKCLALLHIEDRNAGFESRASDHSYHPKASIPHRSPCCNGISPAPRPRHDVHDPAAHLSASSAAVAGRMTADRTPSGGIISVP